MDNLKIQSWEINSFGHLRLKLIGPMNMTVTVGRSLWNTSIRGEPHEVSVDIERRKPYHVWMWRCNAQSRSHPNLTEEEVNVLDTMVLNHPVLKSIAWFFDIKEDKPDE
ncbi:hypothetical protein EKI60_04875 [Candidatus Saccharibacteria bacterium]|nr:MAG: hypothetical protein EKI60_04875 [Candidatus Saccharibacteria bacterium]